MTSSRVTSSTSRRGAIRSSICSAAALACVILFVGSQSLHAELIITFADGDTFDGDLAGSTAGPFNVDGVSGTITTRGVGPDGAVNTVSGQLGINAAGGLDRANSFDDGESWTFDWNIQTFFQGINFKDFSTTTETFTIQSFDWIGLTITPGNSEISFNNTLGSFLFNSGDAADDFDLSDLSGGSLLSVSAGTDVVITYHDSAGGFASIEGMTVSNPEPGTFVLGAAASLALAGCGLWRRRNATRWSRQQGHDASLPS